MSEEIPLAELLKAGAKCDRSGKLWQAFLIFHRDNPWVYARLKELCYKLRDAGYNRYSTRTLISVLRFEWDLKTGGEHVMIDGESRKVKLNNNHSPYYARMMIEELPEFAYFFELRRAEGDPTEMPKPPSFLERMRLRLQAKNSAITPP